ncbi:hypothetical protein B0A48_14658 [Cryoendolithus antarcticus]|uniref:Uncharacterized protein n=1 Tax=Cryoendolithus antarcticus TaxID=1507870 RepID=A0A1V8SK37_9PEZI|nr:hypothetical protein B0A48_14658 [Cryoendolithus antarcticus]
MGRGGYNKTLPSSSTSSSSSSTSPSTSSRSKFSTSAMFSPVSPLRVAGGEDEGRGGYN